MDQLAYNIAINLMVPPSRTITFGPDEGKDLPKDFFANSIQAEADCQLKAVMIEGSIMELELLKGVQYSYQIKKVIRNTSRIVIGGCFLRDNQRTYVAKGIQKEKTITGENA